MKWLDLPRRQLILLLPIACLGLGEAQAQAPIQFDNFKARIDDAARAAAKHTRLKGLSPERREALVEFVSGNMLFVLLHELAHTSITELDLPVLGKEEDAADSFAALTLINIGSMFSQQVLTFAAKGWFMADRRDVKEGNSVPYYDEHGLNQQRAYQIVCYMVGADPVKFKDLATQTKLPKERQETCTEDFEKAKKSWGAVLQSHLRPADKPETKIDVSYGEAKGKLEIAAEIARSVKLLEPVARRSAELVEWPKPFALQMQSCGFINARWSREARTLTLCYELAEDFAELYRGYGDEEPVSKRRKSK